MAFTNSGLVDATRISPNKTTNRNHVIDRITPHCYVGQATVEDALNSAADQIKTILAS